MIAVVDAEGKRTQFIHSTTNQAEIIIDQLGYGSTNYYDLRGNVTTRVNALGQTNRLAYDDKNHVLHTVDALNHTNFFGYDGYGYRNAVTNALGKATLSLFNQFGSLLAKTNALTQVIRFDYDSSGHRTAVVDALGHSNTFSHDIYGRPNFVTNAQHQLQALAGSDSIGDLQFVSQAGGIRMDFGHDVNGNTTNTSYTWINPANTNDTLPLPTLTEFDAANRVTRVVDPDGQDRLTIYDAGGRVAQTVNRLGETNSYLYDARGNLVETTYPDGTVERSVYDARQQVLFTADRHLPGLGANGTHYVYDPLGRATRTERIANVQIDIIEDGVVPRSELISTGAVLSASSTVYDDAGRVRFTTNALNRVTQHEYDAAGRQTAIIDALTNRTDFAYDDAGQLRYTTNALQFVTRYDYDAKGRRIKTVFPDNTYTTNSYNEIGQLGFVIDQATNRTDYEYDSLGRMKAVVLPQVFDPQGGTNGRPRYEYEYDQFGNLLVVRDAKRRETRSTYDALGQLRARVTPKLQTNSFFYNSLGQLDYSVDAKGQTNRYFYDAFGRTVTNLLYAAGAATPAQTNAVEFGPGGQFLRVIRPEGVTVTRYNVEGAVTNISSPEGNLSYEYDPVAGYLTRVYTTNSDVRYAYDELDRLKTVTVVKRNGNPLSPFEVTTNTYTKLGSLEYVYFPNGAWTFHQYDALNRLTNMTHYNSASQVLSRYEYTLAADGQRVASKETRLESGGGYSTTQLGWTNDSLRRLVREVSTSTVAALNFTNAYVYDLAGNRLWKTNVTSAGTQVTSYTYNDDDQLVTDGAFSNFYDANGSVTNRYSNTETNLYEYNLERRLARATILRQEGGSPVAQTNRYAYNAGGIRTRVETTGTGSGTNVFLNDPQNPTGSSQVLEELPAAGATPTVTYTLGSQVLSQEKGGTVSHLLADGHGSTRLLTGTSSAISDRYSFDAYGVPLEFAPGVLSPPQTKILYTGEQLDVGLQQIYLRARYYNPAVGRFGVRDAAEGTPSDPLTLHKYAYTQNNPMNMRDPSGNFSLGEVSVAASLAVTLQTLYDLTFTKVGDMLQTESEEAQEAVSHMESDAANSDVATTIIHGVDGYNLGGGVMHSFGWSKPFQSLLTTSTNAASPPLTHDFYEFNWGGFSIDVIESEKLGPILSVGIVTVKSVHQLASVHLRIAELTVWMKGYERMNIISHSWGTTLAYDQLMYGGVEINNWVTMGSPLNHDISKPIWLTGKWINAFSKRDPVTYLNMYPHSLIDSDWCPVFLPRFAKTPFNPKDVDVWRDTTNPANGYITEHGEYWTYRRLINAIRGELQ